MSDHATHRFRGQRTRSLPGRPSRTVRERSSSFGRFAKSEYFGIGLQKAANLTSFGSGRRLSGRSRLVLENPRREVTRTREHRRRSRTVPLSIRAMTNGASLREHPRSKGRGSSIQPWQPHVPDEPYQRTRSRLSAMGSQTFEVRSAESRSAKYGITCRGLNASQGARSDLHMRSRGSSIQPWQPHVAAR